jgi:hypothetical protein
MSKESSKPSPSHHVGLERRQLDVASSRSPLIWRVEWREVDRRASRVDLSVGDEQKNAITIIIACQQTGLCDAMAIGQTSEKDSA